MGNDYSVQQEYPPSRLYFIPVVGRCYRVYKFLMYSAAGRDDLAISAYLGPEHHAEHFGSVGTFVSPDPGSENYRDYRIIKGKLKPGDILEFNRGAYSHYALYMGEGMVMNIDIILSGGGVGIQAKILERNYEDVCRQPNGEMSKVRISNHDWEANHFFDGMGPKSAAEIVALARKYQNKTVIYSLMWQNCEYYCTLWRFGKGFSTQVAQLSTTSVGAAVNGQAFAESSVNEGINSREAAMYAKYNEFEETQVQI